MGFWDYSLIDIFKFEKRDVTSHMMYKLHLGSKIRDGFNYLAGKLGVQKLPKSLDKIKWYEGKNYHWAFIQDENVTFGIRQYHNHYTIFVKREKGEDDWKAKYSIFTFHTDRDQLSDKEQDERVEDWTFDLNKHIKDLFKMAKEDQLHGLWNNRMFERPDYIKVKNVWNGGEDDVNDIELFIFACEEMFNKFLEVFAQTDMLDHIKKVKKGDKLGNYTVLDVKTKVEDDYYHAVGIKWKSEREEKFEDVYSLTRWHFAEVFPNGYQPKIK